MKIEPYGTHICNPHILGMILTRSTQQPQIIPHTVKNPALQAPVVRYLNTKQGSVELSTSHTISTRLKTPLIQRKQLCFQGYDHPFSCVSPRYIYLLPKNRYIGILVRDVLTKSLKLQTVKYYNQLTRNIMKT